MITRSIHIAFQHVHKFAQFAARIDGRRGVLDAVLHVRVNDLFRKGFDGAAGRHQLHEHIGAVVVFRQHAFDGIELAGDFSQSGSQRLRFLGRMSFMMIAGHGVTLRKKPALREPIISLAGHGGRGHSSYG